MYVQYVLECDPQSCLQPQLVLRIALFLVRHIPQYVQLTLMATYTLVRCFFLRTGVAVILVMLITTFLVTLIMVSTWEMSLLVMIHFFVVFVVIEGSFLSSNLIKVSKGKQVGLGRDLSGHFGRQELRVSCHRCLFDKLQQMKG